MMKKIVLVLAVAVCMAAADPIRQRPLRRRVSARQQLEQPAPTGYPAAGFTPDVPFELPTETQEPDSVYGPPEAEPDVVYGPPIVEAEVEAEPQPDSVYGPPETEAQEPDSVYGPPETQSNPDIAEEELEEEVAEDIDEAEEEILINEDGSVIALSTTFDQGQLEEKPARLVYQRFPQRRQPPTSVPARLTLAKIRQPANFVYTARYQSL